MDSHSAVNDADLFSRQILLWGIFYLLHIETISIIGVDKLVAFLEILFQHDWINAFYSQRMEMISLISISGSEFGLSMIINIEQYEYLPWPNSDAGIKVTICLLPSAKVCMGVMQIQSCFGLWLNSTYGDEVGKISLDNGQTRIMEISIHS